MERSELRKLKYGVTTIRKPRNSASVSERLDYIEEWIRCHDSSIKKVEKRLFLQ